MHCVQCGKQRPIYRDNRDRECWEAWDAAGRVRSETWVKDHGWMKVGGTRWFNVARYCRNDGNKLNDPNTYTNSREAYALRCGRECVTCDGCSISKKFPSSPCPSPIQKPEQSTSTPTAAA